MSNNVSNKNSSRKPDPEADLEVTAAKPATVEAGTAPGNARSPLDAPRFVAPSHGGVDILKLLTELEDQVEGTRKGPFNSLLGFDDDKFHMTIMKIRANLPEEMKRASKLAKDQERIVEETLESSERMKEDARKAALADVERGKKEAASLRDQGRQEAEQERQEAQSEARRLTAEANTAVDLARQAAEREAQEVLTSAREHSRQILDDARAQAAHLVSDHQIVQQAQAQAQDAQLRAEHEAQAVRRGADDYARDVLMNLENVLGRATLQVQRGREMLEKPR